MRFGIRTPSLKKRFAARTSWKRVVRHSMGFKAPRGLGFVTNPKRALYNAVYNRTSVSVDRLGKTGKIHTSYKPNQPAKVSGSFWLNMVIFIVLTVVFFPLGIGFLIYKLYKRSKKPVIQSAIPDSKALVNNSQSSNKLLNQFYIPEPTRSLLWVTDEDTSKISSPNSIQITLNLSTGTTETNDGHNFFGEPSLIWTRLPIQPNSELETKPMYYPSYSALYPTNRFQYLNWLRDITQETNLSYVFLYYYGLERHMLVGNYDLAVDEILRLLKFHGQGSFKGYATSALIAASAYRKRTDIISKAPFILEDISNNSLLLRRLAEVPLTAKDIINLSSMVGFTNKRYIKQYPDLFEAELQKLVDKQRQDYGDILGGIVTDTLPKSSNIFFANLSLPEKIRTIEVPDLVHSPDLAGVLKKLLTKTHEIVKKSLISKKTNLHG